MLAEWIARQSDENDRLDADEALADLWEIVSSAPNEALSDLLAELTEGSYESLVDIPLDDQDAIELLVPIIDRLAPNSEQSEVLEHRFPLTWSMGVFGGEEFEPRPLLNGAVLVRNLHRVLGPSMSEGVMLEMDAKLAATLSTDLKTLRSRNSETSAACFLLTHDARGARLLGSDETVDIAAPGWGQLIAVCALEGASLRTAALRLVGQIARSMVVFLRFFGDRVDLIPAARYDDELDVFLEAMAIQGLSSELEAGMDLPEPLVGDALTKDVIECIKYSIDQEPTEGVGGAWFQARAIPALASRLSATMMWATVNFGLGSDPNGPRRLVPLPNGVEDAIASDPALKRRSVTLQLMTVQEAARDMITDGTLMDRLTEAFTESGVEGVELHVIGRIDHDVDQIEASSALVSAEELTDAFSNVLGLIAEQAEEEGEEFEEAIINASLGLVLLMDFPKSRPPDLKLAAMARALSRMTGDTVQLFLNGRGEYLAYADGYEDSGDHELFRLDD
jgi:hypothetical protein